MPPAIGGPRGQDLSKSSVARLAIGGLFVGSLLIVSAISYDNTITPRAIVIHHSSVMPAIIQLGPNATDRLPLDLDSCSTGYVGSASSIGEASTILATTS